MKFWCMKVKVEYLIVLSNTKQMVTKLIILKNPFTKNKDKTECYSTCNTRY